MKGITKTIKNETKEQKGGFLLWAIRYSRIYFVRKHVSRKRIIRAGYGKRKGKGIV